MSRKYCFRGVWGHPISSGNPEISIDLPKDSMFDFGQLNTQFVFQVLFPFPLHMNAHNCKNFSTIRNFKYYVFTEGESSTSMKSCNSVIYCYKLVSNYIHF